MENLITIGKLSKIFGISTRTIRHYEKIGLIKCSFNSPINNYRQYGEKEIKQLERILIFKSLGFSLQHIAQIQESTEINTIEKIFDEKLEDIEMQILKLNRYKNMISSAKKLITSQGIDCVNKEELIKELFSLNNTFIKTFCSLNTNFQSKILLELYRTGTLSLDTIKEIGTSDSAQLLNELHMMIIKSILSKVDGLTEKNIIEKLEKNNPEFADNVKMNMFTFEDVIMLPDDVMKKWLKKCDDENLSISLNASGRNIQKRILNNLSTKRAEDLRNNITSNKEYSLDETYQAMTCLVKILRQMDISGEIEIDRI